MHKLDFLEERKKWLEKVLLSNQRMINKYMKDAENLQQKYDEQMLKYNFLSEVLEKKEQFETDIIAGTMVFAVGSLPGYLNRSGTIPVVITTLIGLGVCGDIVLLRNQTYLEEKLILEI